MIPLSDLSSCDCDDKHWTGLICLNHLSSTSSHTTDWSLHFMSIKFIFFLFLFLSVCLISAPSHLWAHVIPSFSTPPRYYFLCPQWFNVLFVSWKFQFGFWENLLSFCLYICLISVSAVQLIFRLLLQNWRWESDVLKASRPAKNCWSALLFLSWTWIKMFSIKTHPHPVFSFSHPPPLRFLFFYLFIIIFSLTTCHLQISHGSISRHNSERKRKSSGFCGFVAAAVVHQGQMWLPALWLSQPVM